MTVFVNIGSNLGNRRLNLSRAMRALGEEFGPYEISHAVESDPWGFDSGHRFLNVGMCFSSDLEPEKLLDRIQAIESTLSPAPHRNADGSYADRVIDIDIMAIDSEVFDSHRLHVPHPHLAERAFFLEPMKELAPGWHHPRSGKTPGEMLEDLLLGSK